MTTANTNNRNETKSNIFPLDIFKSDTFFIKIYKVFQCLSKSQFLNFMAKLNPNHGNETKSDIFPWDIFKSNVIYHWL